MRIPEGHCPCGSGTNAGDCCYQIENAPIDRPLPIRLNSLELNVEAYADIVNSAGAVTSIPINPNGSTDFEGLTLPDKITPVKNITVTLPREFKTSDFLVQNDAIYKVVKTAQEHIAKRLPPNAQLITQQNLTDVLYERTLITVIEKFLRAVHYHQQSFVYRFLRLSQDFNGNPVHLGGITQKVTDEDAPLQFEFASFITCHRTCVESLIKLMAFKATHYDPRKKSFKIKDALTTILNGKTKRGCYLGLTELLSRYEPWLDEQRKIRNAIMHDGLEDALSGFEHVRGATLNATILNRTADVMCIEMYRKLMDFATSVLRELYAISDGSP